LKPRLISKNFLKFKLIMLTVLVFNVAFIENLQLIHNIKMINQQNQ